MKEPKYPSEKTKFPRIINVLDTNYSFWETKVSCGKYSKEESIQGRKLLISRTF